MSFETYDLDRHRKAFSNTAKVNTKENKLALDDVLLVPQYSTVRSRSDIDLGQNLDSNIKLNIPIISSPMDTVTETEMACAMSAAGGLGVLHRYKLLMDHAEMAFHCHERGVKNIAAAIGVTGDYLIRAEALVNIGKANILCLDIAHGHHVLMERALKSLKDIYGESVHLMAGNIATLEGFNDLADWGADSIRCGIGGGSICTTRIQTGHGVPGLATIFECAKSDRDAKIIADGGIKNSGDIVKALAAGADFVLLGSLLSGTGEAPGEAFVGPSGGLLKDYRGMASAAAQNNWRGKIASHEGVVSTVPYKGTVKEVLGELERGIRSGLSYSGASNLKQLRINSLFIKQSDAGRYESSAHILNRQ